MMKRSNYGERSRLAKGRRVVRVLMAERDEANVAAATAKSKQLDDKIGSMADFWQET
jgi:hypothetical protein